MKTSIRIIRLIFGILLVLVSLIFFIAWAKLTQSINTPTNDLVIYFTAFISIFAFGIDNILHFFGDDWR